MSVGSVTGSPAATGAAEGWGGAAAGGGGGGGGRGGGGVGGGGGGGGGGRVGGGGRGRRGSGGGLRLAGGRGGVLGVDRLHELDGVVAGVLPRLDRHEQAGALAVDLGGIARDGGLGFGDRLRLGRRGGGRGLDRRAVVEALRAGVVAREVRLLEARLADHVAGLRRVDELVAAHRDRDVVDVAGLAEEDEVARPQVAAVDARSVRGGELRVGHARDLDAGLCVRPLRQSGAVEAGLRRRAAPLVRLALVLLGLGERRERAGARAAATAARGSRRPSLRAGQR